MATLTPIFGRLSRIQSQDPWERVTEPIRNMRIFRPGAATVYRTEQNANRTPHHRHRHDTYDTSRQVDIAYGHLTGRGHARGSPPAVRGFRRFQLPRRGALGGRRRRRRQRAPAARAGGPGRPQPRSRPRTLVARRNRQVPHRAPVVRADPRSGGVATDSTRPFSTGALAAAVRLPRSREAGFPAGRRRAGIAAGVPGRPGGPPPAGRFTVPTGRRGSGPTARRCGTAASGRICRVLPARCTPCRRGRAGRRCR